MRNRLFISSIFTLAILAPTLVAPVRAWHHHDHDHGHDHAPADQHHGSDSGESDCPLCAIAVSRAVALEAYLPDFRPLLAEIAVPCHQALTGHRVPLVLLARAPPSGL
jgi:hypothetical protein